MVGLRCEAFGFGKVQSIELTNSDETAALCQRGDNCEEICAECSDYLETPRRSPLLTFHSVDISVCFFSFFIFTMFTSQCTRVHSTPLELSAARELEALLYASYCM